MSLAPAFRRGRGVEGLWRTTATGLAERFGNRSGDDRGPGALAGVIAFDVRQQLEQARTSRLAMSRLSRRAALPRPTSGGAGIPA